MTPTESLYINLQNAYKYFNNSLFMNKLPDVIFTTQRKKGVMGYFSSNRWKNQSGDYCHEIAINPAYVSRSTTLEVFQTLVHEMSHAYQHIYGKPSRNGYHNSEFYSIMQERGLIPSSTGRAGGAKTGQRMSDYPEKDGDFIKASIELIEKGIFKVDWIDRKTEIKSEKEHRELIDELISIEIESETAQALMNTINEDIEILNEKEAAPKKTCYHCNLCNYSLWGKANLNLQCLDCKSPLSVKNK
mgnify:CR=1 FL=1|jgi:predicted SprT family Zn-dependent metalloprotease